MFCYISKNWRGQPLISVEATVALIASTTTKGGLKVVCMRDDNPYALGQAVSDEEINALNIERDAFHGEWNYIIRRQDT
jgi:hypothetical protein